MTTTPQSLRKQLITDAMLVLALKAYLPLGPKAVVTDAWLLDTPEAKGMRAALEVAFATRLESDAGDARRYSELMQKTLNLINAIPSIERYKGEYLWPMNPDPAKVKGVMSAISDAVLFIDRNPRDTALRASAGGEKG